jgi:hypothetical protein
MRTQTARQLSRLADRLKESGPDVPAHQHVRDAARMVRSGREEAAQRHLRAALFSLTPQSLMRNGLHTDDQHLAARYAMHGVHRHLLLVKDIADVDAKNQEAIRRDSYDTATAQPQRPDPNAGYGPGALAQKPTARQPPGNQALNAPAGTSSGGSDPNVANPAGPQPRGSKQFTSWDSLSRVIELNWAKWDAGERGSASRQAHDTASATARATALRDRATQVHALADDAESKFPGTGKIIHAAADAFSQGDAVTAGNKLTEAQTALQQHPRIKAEASQRRPLSPADRDFSALNNQIKTHIGAASQAAAGLAGSWDELSAVIELVGPKGWSHGWVYHGVPGGMVVPGKHDPRSITAVGGGRKDWMNEASQMPDARARHDFPAIAGRMRQITPERLQQARSDATRISSGIAPLHPELAQIWPDVYGKAPGGGKALPVPKAPRNRPDPYSVTGLESPQVSYIKAAVRQGLGMANEYGLSAETGRLAVTPAPRGKPGGPGLYDVKGNMHSPYMQNIVKALIRKGHPPGEAYKIAWGSMRRWAKGGGNVHPEVRAAAAGGLALEKVAQARAHAHANSWDELGAVIEMAANPNQQRAVNGEFGSGGQGAQQQQGQQKSASSATAGKTASASAKAKIAQSQQSKQALLSQAAGYQKQASQLEAQRAVLQQELASASGKTSSGQSGSTTSSAGSTTSSGASTTSSSSSTTPSSSSTTSSSTPASSSAAATAAPGSAAASASATQLQSQIDSLTTQIDGLLQKAAAAAQQAAAM